MKRLLLELGGKGAAVVFDDADLAAAVGAISSTWAFHSGPDLHGPHPGDRPAGDPRPASSPASGRGRPAQGRGPPRAPRPSSGRSSPAQRDRIESHVRAGVEEGATVVAGGERPDVSPRLLRRPHPAGRGQAGHAHRPGGDLRPGRGGARLRRRGRGRGGGQRHRLRAQRLRVHRRHRPGLRVARQLRSGSVALNTAQQSPEAPFGGFKLSGVGRDRGSFALHAYSELQSIVWPG